MKLFDCAVIIGRFQPLHNGHLQLLNKALEVAKDTIVLIGSSNQPRTPKNPWSWEERARVISGYLEQSPSLGFTSEDFSDDFVLSSKESSVRILPLNDHKYNDMDWVAEVQELVADHSNDGSVVIIGHHKEDESTYYLDLFPQWSYIGVDTGLPAESSKTQIEATDIRNNYFRLMSIYRHGSLELGTFKGKIGQDIPTATRSMLMEFLDTENAKYVLDEFLYYKDYPKVWGRGPFVTADAAVFCCGHILLIRRGQVPGKGLYALPGGFLNDNEFIASGIVRELREETLIKVPVPVLHGSMKHIEVFDRPDRSLRGRTITHCGLINLRDKSLPEIRGSDDADKAIWVPLSEFFDQYRDRMFEDHFDIINRMKSLIK